MIDNKLLIEKTKDIYSWIDEQIQKDSTKCKACGTCCNFKDFDHQLYITTPEFIYFKENMDPNNIKPMIDGKCPYCIKGKCTVYNYRFAGCRIFYCDGDLDLQSEISEKVVRKFSALCDKLDVQYQYSELSSALKTL